MAIHCLRTKSNKRNNKAILHYKVDSGHREKFSTFFKQFQLLPPNCLPESPIYIEQDQGSKAPSGNYPSSSFMTRLDHIMTRLDYPFPDLTRFDLIQLD